MLPLIGVAVVIGGLALAGAGVVHGAKKVGHEVKAGVHHVVKKIKPSHS